jgi:hypothetical protein
VSGKRETRDRIVAYACAALIFTLFAVMAYLARNVPL